MILPLFNLLLTSALIKAQPSIDLSSKDSVLAASKAAMPALKQYFDANTPGNGAWIETIVQWHETGMYFDLFYQYYAYSGDPTYNEWVDTQMQLTVGGNRDFLEGNNPTMSLAGRWNDDIGWWALATMTAAETTKNGIIAPHSIIPGMNPTYLEVTNNTYYQMYMNWDDACGGGMFWSRDRQTRVENSRYYKSSITNAQHVDMGARLYALTKDEAYLKLSDRVYKWMKSSGLIDSNYAVHDGIDSRTCLVESVMYSYHSGEIIAGLSSLYEHTGNPYYIEEAHNHLKYIQSYFTKDNGIFGPVYEGLANLHAITPDAGVKKSITDILHASARSVFQICDSKWYCIRQRPGKHRLKKERNTPCPDGTNPRDQFEVVALLNSLAIINGAKISQKTQTLVEVKPPPANEESSKGINSTLLYGGIGGGAALLLLIGGAVVWNTRRRKEIKSIPLVDYQDSVPRNGGRFKDGSSRHPFNDGRYPNDQYYAGAGGGGGQRKQRNEEYRPNQTKQVRGQPRSTENFRHRDMVGEQSYPPNTGMRDDRQRGQGYDGNQYYRR
ncbi:glycosyl hydrolase family 76-domain-containing protein [Obelidium mucronatum]|nr:glycosyl hydrolase family 76-domain-containing protein [Obelidium mucronatum]